ncbi:hypothetical protein KR51_00016990, partial [Rubidibacter lacunae KORDI 51-2]
RSLFLLLESDTHIFNLVSGIVLLALEKRLNDFKLQTTDSIESEAGVVLTHRILLHFVVLLRIQPTPLVSQARKILTRIAVAYWIDFFSRRE